jgi:hypothetical protein
MSGNYHVRFLGGKEAAKPLTYPVLQLLAGRGKNKTRAKNYEFYIKG